MRRRSGWPRKTIPKKSYASRSWKSAVGKELDAGVDLRQPVAVGVRQRRLDAQALDARHVEQLVVDAESRLAGQVVGGVEAGQERVLLARRVAQPAEHVEDALGVDDQGRLVVLA